MSRVLRRIEPIEHPIDARPPIPGSKSFTNRALLVAALANGTTTLDGVLFADDTDAMVGCLTSIGIELAVDRAARRVVVHGIDGVVPAAPPGRVLDVRQSGTTARFLPPMLALGEGSYAVDGDAQMRKRPMGDLATAIRAVGGRLEGDGDRLPFTVVGGGVRGGAARLAGHVSSQFLSGLLLSAPYFAEGLTVELTSELVSKPYIDVTLATMAAFGVDVANDRYRVFDVRPGRYQAPIEPYAIEPDASAASYFFAAAALCGGTVEVVGLGQGAVQGDVRFADLLGAMGATVVRAGKTLAVSGPPDGVLRGIDADMGDCSDTAQTLAAVAAFATGSSRVRGIGFIRRKETDRIAAVVRELERCGIEAIEEDDGFVVHPSPAGPHGAVIETYDDHRMAMSFALIGLRVPGIEIADPGCVTKTFPGYFDVLEALR